jgi:hypothetical protein
MALGAGLRLFAELGGQTKLELAGDEAYDSGVVNVTYGPA